MAISAILLGLGLLWGYIVLAVYATRKAWAFTASRPDWLRVLLCTLVLTVFFAPGFMGAGHGVGLAPAWVALVDPGSNRFAVKGALVSLAVTWSVLFVGGVVARSIRKHRQ